MEYWLVFIACLQILINGVFSIDPPPSGYRLCNGDFNTPGPCLQAVDEAKGWWDADYHCKKNLAHPGSLVTIKDAGMQDWVASVAAYLGWNNVWINGYLKHLLWHWYRRPHRQYLAFQGCFPDDEYDRDLPMEITLHSGSTPSDCLEKCKDKNKEYASVQMTASYTMMCRCGDSYGKHWRSTESSCDSFCPTATASSDVIDKYCGSIDQQIVYHVNGKKYHNFYGTIFEQNKYCAVLDHTKNYKWTTRNCHEKKPYICEYDLEKDACRSSGFHWANCACVKIHYEEKAFYDAVSACYAQNSNLLRIINETLQENLSPLLHPDKSYYLGLAEEYWKYANDTIITYFNWAGNQPNYEANKVCLNMVQSNNYRWHTAHWDDSYPFFCMIDIPGQHTIAPSQSMPPNVTPSPDTRITSTPVPSTDATTKKTSRELSQDLIIGLAAGAGGALLLAVLVGLCIFLIVRKRILKPHKKPQQQQQVTSSDNKYGPDIPSQAERIHSPAMSRGPMPSNHHHRTEVGDGTWNAGYVDVISGYEGLDNRKDSSHSYARLNIPDRSQAHQNYPSHMNPMFVPNRHHQVPSRGNSTASSEAPYDYIE